MVFRSICLSSCVKREGEEEEEQEEQEGKCSSSLKNSSLSFFASVCKHQNFTSDDDDVSNRSTQTFQASGESTNCSNCCKARVLSSFVLLLLLMLLNENKTARSKSSAIALLSRTTPTMGDDAADYSGSGVRFILLCCYTARACASSNTHVIA